MKLSGLLAETIVELFKGVYARKGYAFFDGGKGFNLNIIGVRRDTNVPNSFDDMIMVICRDGQGAWEVYSYVATTDPGTYWLEHPQNVKGTAILIPGQYRGSHMIGKHKGQYAALVQCGPLKVWRDSDRDNELDFDGVEDEGLYGINIHRASSQHTSSKVDKWSAGCQVIASTVDFSELMAMVHGSAARYGPTFTYTLLDEADLTDAIRMGQSR